MSRRLSLVASVCLFAGLVSCKGGEGALSLEVLCGIDVPAGDTDLGDPDGVAPEDLAGRDLPDVAVDDLADPGPLDTPDVPPATGEFGSPCQGNRDCISGFCIEGADGFVCTQICVTECPEGWACRTYTVGADVQSLCSPSGVNLCKTCKADIQCGDGLCLDLAEGKYCGRDCTNGACPSGYQCSDVVAADNSVSRQCKPVNGTCTCRITSDGQERSCLRENSLGRCLGFETCSPALGWIGCSAREPSVEDCNGIDDDCSGIADDNPVPPAASCLNTIPSVGSCPGAYVCRGEAGWNCAGPSPAAEACNYLDDNCDGQTDEPFKDESGRYGSLENCGQCGVSCVGRVPFAKTVICDRIPALPVCAVTECEQGYVKINSLVCAPEVSNLCVPCTEDANCGAGGANRCLSMGATTKFCGRDCGAGAMMGSDCPLGYKCQDFGAGVLQCIPMSGTCECTTANAGIVRLCQVTNAAGVCSGTETCDAALGWVNCTARTPTPEFCNGADDDCNGFVDDAVVPPAEPCAVSWTDPGNHAFTCTQPWTCQESGLGVKWVCNAPTPKAEVCNGRDENCDGRIDEDFKVPGTDKYGTFDNCGACGVSCAGLVPNATMKCSALPAVPTCVVDTCNTGFWKSSDLSCSEFPQNACQECASDRSCQVPGDSCVAETADGRKHCLWDCSPASLHPVLDPVRGTCPQGYTCRQTDALGNPFLKCVPTSGTCDCLAENAGDVRICAIENAFGRCTGQEACAPAQGWTGCTALTPAAERCNGVDDDCNGLTDETWPSLNAVCVVGRGRCLATGTFVCDPSTGNSVKCSANPGAPINEVCNDIDDDCNGLVDDAPLFADKGKTCFAGAGECLAAGVLGCSRDGRSLSCSAVPLLSKSELCNGRDDNCNGQIDEDFVLKGKFCTAGVGECAANGVYQCSPDGLGVACDAVQKATRTEICDGLDNDCDGTTDETWPAKGDVCTVGAGACLRTGTQVCNVAGTGLTCNATAGVATTETCNGIDDNCNGSIDETWPDKGRACQRGVGECLANGVNVCRADGSGIDCNAVVGTSTAEKCDGLDNNCDGSIDETWTQKGTTCSAGAGACLRNGVNECRTDGAGIQCSAVAGTPATEACNGLDDNCDGAIDENWPTKNTSCVVGQGTCLRNGVQVCAGDGSGLQCNVTAGTPTTERCNGLDDNCDGAIDETWANKGQPCVAGVGACLQSGILACRADGSGVQCSVTAGTPTAETCNGIDDNCDGAIDETFTTKGQPCTVGQGICLRTGVNLCMAAGTGVECNATPGAAGVETCNGLDDNCNGQIDETFTTKGQPCTSGQGVCLRTGVNLCRVDGTGVQCNALAGAAGAETCNGLDDNCDGVVDDPWPTKGQPCSAGVGECQRAGTLVCKGDGTGLACNAVAGGAVAEKCNGLDDDCNGATDETFATKGTVCTAGVGQCVRTGTYVCTGDGQGTSCNALPGATGTETCNYLDDDCDGTTDNTYRDLVTGRYNRDSACGNCFTDCTLIYALPSAFGTCDATLTSPTCRLNCTTDHFNLNDVPDDGCEFFLDATAVYVSVNDPLGANDASCGLGPTGTGTGNHPCRSIAQGIARATALTRGKVLVADGLYQETVTLTNGRSLQGGYRADTWERHVASTLTIIRGQASTPAAPGAVNAIGITGTAGSTVLDGFNILGPNNLATGASSYGIYVRNSTGALTLSNNVVEGGVGGTGVKGADGSNGSTGVGGTGGGSSYGAATTTCSALTPALPRAGSGGGALTCGGVAVSGGAGGGNTCPPVYNAAPVTYENGAAGSGAAPGAGGPGGYDREAWYCSTIPPDGECHQPSGGSEVGNPGGLGGGGTNGTTAGANGCASSGLVSSGIWQGTNGLTGAAGTAGSGGGGGGAGGGARNGSGCTARTQIGGAGGGGGSGGCGGSGGLGGGSGGGSFAIFLAWDSVPATVPTVTGNTIRGGQGGAGGYGGNGGSGAPGGSGGAGGTWNYATSKCAAPGGAGGEGGNGGHGEGGGGGCGGPSYGIFASGSGAVNLGSYVSANTVVVGLTSSGGSGGASIGTPGDSGSGGAAAATNF